MSPGARNDVPAEPRRTVFLIDDDATLRGFIRRWLSARTGLEVHTFGNGAHAVEAMALASPGVVLRDLDLPGLTGEDVARAAKRLPRPPRVILMSGDAARLELASGLAEATLAKPFSVTDLLSILEGPRGSRGC
jgi:CheY-like chemotaxis protein